MKWSMAYMDKGVGLWNLTSKDLELDGVETFFLFKIVRKAN